MSILHKTRIELGERVAESFSKIPVKAQSLFFASLYSELIDCNAVSGTHVMLNTGLDFSDCKSPIEIIFDMAYAILESSLIDFKNTAYSLWRQQEIQCGKKTYYADFCFDTDNANECYEYELPYKLVIECDGHDFHEKTKAQVAKNNERDMDLKKAGYDVIHFSGSQIFNNPLKCASDAMELIMKNVGEVKVVEG